MKNPGIYILTNTVNGKQYVGRDSNLPKRTKEHLSGRNPECDIIHKAIKKYGADAFDVEIIRYPGISHEALDAVEFWTIRQLQTLTPKGYNLRDGGSTGKHSKVTRQKMSESNHKRVADGTHNLLDGEVQRRTQKKRLEDGTHNLLGKNNPSHQRVADGTHNFLDESNPSHKRVADGTHHWLSGEMQREVQRKRIDEGIHHFLDSEFQRRTNKKRLEDGTHNLLGGEVQRRSNKKRVEDGTHHLLGKNPNVIVRLAKAKYKIVYQYAVMIPVCFWHALNSVYVHRKLTREGFYDKDIPDTSNAEQEYLF